MPTPAAIAGPTSVCTGSTITLTDATTGGTWSSFDSSIAYVGYSTGTVLGLSTGVGTIYYTMPTGCYMTYSVTVNAAPDGILAVSYTHLTLPTNREV